MFNSPLSLRRRLSLVATLFVAGCAGGSGGSSAVSVVSGDDSSAAAIKKVKLSAVPTPTPSPVALTPPSTASMAMPTGASVPSPSLSGLDPIASGIDVAKYLQPAWGTGGIPATMAPDVVGAFRFLCAPSHNAYDDPIVFPGQPGKSHLHTFFGNTGANANSTYASLRTSGQSTCNNFLNRSAYWMPALMNGRGKVVMPDFASIYYKRRPSNDPECQRMGKACLPLPRGLRYVFGHNMGNPSDPMDNHYFNCDDRTGGVQGHYPNIAQAAVHCPAGARLGVVINSPDCWNGTELDSADHRSHMAYPSYGNWGYLKCPATHPYVLPQFTLAAWFTTDDTLDRSGDESPNANTWYFVSDRMPGMAPAVPGSTFHTDWFGAWEDSIMSLWMANCIDKLLSCSGGDLGQGQQITPTAGYSYANRTILVDPPAKP